MAEALTTCLFKFKPVLENRSRWNARTPLSNPVHTKRPVGHVSFHTTRFFKSGGVTSAGRLELKYRKIIYIVRNICTFNWRCI